MRQPSLVLVVIDQPLLPLLHRRLRLIDQHQRVPRLNRLKQLILDAQTRLVIGGPPSQARGRTELLDLDHCRISLLLSLLQVIHRQTYHSSRMVRVH